MTAKPVFRNVARPLDRADFSPGGMFESDARSLDMELKTADDLVPAGISLSHIHFLPGQVSGKRKLSR